MESLSMQKEPPPNQTCKQSNRSNRKVIDWSQLRCNSNRLKFFKCNSNSNRLKFYLLHLLLSIIFLLQFTLLWMLNVLESLPRLVRVSRSLSLS